MNEEKIKKTPVRFREWELKAKNELSAVKCLSPRSFKFFHRWFNISNFHPGVSQQFMVVFLVVILRFWRPKKSFTSISYPFSQRFVVLVRGHPLIIVLILRIFFHSSGAIQESFQFDSPDPSFRDYSYSTFSSRSPNLTGAFSFSSNCSMVYLLSGP